MSVPGPEDTTQAAVSDRTLALVVYVLYLAAYITGITAIIGVIVAHMRAGTSDAVVNSHYQFQIRTFWIGLLYIIIGALLTVVMVGFLVLLWWFFWSLIRSIKGILALNENRAIQNPTSWLFG
jgi:uncharacterized membrane protein